MSKGHSLPPDSSPAPNTERAVPIARRLVRGKDGARGRAFPLLWRRDRGIEPMPMVAWFDPVQLIDTGIKTVFSLVVGQRSDQRIVQALAARRHDFYDYTGHGPDGRDGPTPEQTPPPRDEIWIDYVCDTGDGWNPTYAVAYAVSQSELEVGQAGSPDTCRLPRGDILVFGGDEVYPTPTREEYHRRLIVPYETAFGDGTGAPPDVFAIPGNHDWYDGLSAFSRLFCSDVGGRHFAGWRTRQRRSYFALKLPGRWWLIASDGQLQSDLDTPQIDYFRGIAERHMEPGDRAIVCLSLPVWVYAHKYRQFGRVFDETDLLYLHEEVFARRGVEVKVFLSGDLHHYRRHEELTPADPAARVQKITAGGGGAFLHPTHDEDVTRLTEENAGFGRPPRAFALQTSYPDLRQSRRLSWGNLLFGWKNPTFGIVPALVYLMTAWIVGSSLDYQRPRHLLDSLTLTVQAFGRNPGLTLWVLFVITIFVIFTDTHSRLYRWLGGLAHAAAHWTGIFYIGWGATVVAGWLAAGSPLSQFLLGAVLVGTGGWIVGSFIMGLYLLTSLNVFGRHSEEAFSALRVEDFKHFLRLHITRDGTLTIYPIKIERVPRRWAGRPGGRADTLSRVVPRDRLTPELIEPPIVLRPSPARPTA